MPRKAREKAESGIYHVMLRGINRQDIFHNDEDYQKFIATIGRVKNVDGFELFGYCLMANHAHLLIREVKDEIAKVMKRIGVSYASWYNCKYDRAGHVFQDRFKSEIVENDRYLISVLRYIHNNPVKAQLVAKPEEYNWSSCRTYYGLSDQYQGLTSTEFVLGILSENKSDSNMIFKEFMNQSSPDQHLDLDGKVRKKDCEVYAEIEKLLNGQPISALQVMEKAARDTILHQIKKIEGVSQRQIARVTGINQNIIFKA